MNTPAEKSPHQTPVAALVNELGLLRKDLADNSRVTGNLASAVRTQSLIPLCVVVLSGLGYLLWSGKISEGSFVGLACACLSPFFGDGIGRVVEKLPIVGRKAEAVKAASMLVFSAVGAAIGMA